MNKKGKAIQLLSEFGKLIFVLVHGLTEAIEKNIDRNARLERRISQIVLMGLVLSGTIITVQATSSYDYAVPILDQRAYPHIGESACAPTSIAMLLNFYYPGHAIDMPEIFHAGIQGYIYNNGPARGYINVGFATGDSALDEVRKIEPNPEVYYVGTYSGLRSPEAGANYLNQIWGGESYGGSATDEDVIDQIKKRPVILNMLYEGTRTWNGDHWEESGHYVVLRGYDNKGTLDMGDDVFSINDPYNGVENRNLSFNQLFGAREWVGPKTLTGWFKGRIITFEPRLSEFQRKYTVVVDNNDRDKLIVDTEVKSEDESITDENEKYIWREYYGPLGTGGNWLYPRESGQTAEWHPMLVDNGDGYYDITAVFYDNNAGDDVEYVIYDKDNNEIGRATVEQENSKSWRNVNLGTYYLAKAKAPYVKINNVPAGFNIDAIRFERIHGLLASYYNAPIYQNKRDVVAEPKAVRIDPNVDLNWRPGSSTLPAGVSEDDAWSVDWKGFIYAEEAADYEFKLISDDGSWLYINGDYVINAGHSNSVHLNKGFNSIIVKYYECCWGPAYVKLQWKPPGASGFIVVPQDVLFVTAPEDMSAKLQVTKKAPIAMTSGGEMVYTIYYQNYGGTKDSAAVLEDKLPEEVDFVSASDGQTPNADGVISWNFDSVDAFPNGYGSKTVTVRIDPEKVTAGSTVIENSAKITYGGETSESTARTKIVGSNLPEGVTLDGARYDAKGSVSLYWMTPITFKYYSSCATKVGINIHFTGSGSDMSGEMVETSENEWSYKVEQFAPHHGSATVTYSVEGCEKTPEPFNIYIDPAGYVYDIATGDRIAGASVWLQQPDGSGGWENVSTELDPPRMQPNENPLTTNADGQYQWDVLKGIYRVHVEASGYYPEDSIVVNIPPPVFDLNVGLERIEVPDELAPVTTLTLSGTFGNDGWYISDVEVNLTAIDNEDGSGINVTEYSLDGVIWNEYSGNFTVNSQGVTDLYYRSRDNTGNFEENKVQTFKIDTMSPVISINVPEDGASYALNENVLADWQAVDSESGIASVTATAANGTMIDTATVGIKGFSVNATDNAGNLASETVTYNVVYNFSGVLPPISQDGTSVFNLGRTIPVKFQLRNTARDCVSTAIAKIYLSKISEDVTGEETEANSTSSATTGNLFRYDATENQYIFNLATKPLSVGTWQIRIELDDGTNKYVNMGLR